MMKLPTPGFVAWFLVIHAVRAVTPISYVFLTYLLSSWCFGAWSFAIVPELSISFASFTLWMVLEALFFPYHLLVHEKLQQLRNPTHACASLAEREALVRRCLDAIALASGHTDPAQVQAAHLDLISRWFHGAPIAEIRRENFEEWIAWAFFYRDPATLDPHERAQLPAVADRAEAILRHRFPPGRAPAVRCIRLSLDPLRATPRPLVHYAVVAAMRAAGLLGVRALGFRPRPFGPCGRLFHRPAAPPPRGGGAAPPPRPIVFVHGLGVGFGMYLPLLARLPAAAPAYLLEWPSTAMALGAEAAPEAAGTARAVAAALRRDGCDAAGACVVGHSYGTAAVAWLLRSRDPAVRRVAAAVVLIDPIVFLLFDSDVVHNFIHRRPKTGTELMIEFFVARELYIANTLSRQFSWSHSALFPEDLPPAGGGGGAGGPAPTAAVFLSGADAIVPSAKVHGYLLGWNRREASRARRRRSGAAAGGTGGVGGEAGADGPADDSDGDCAGGGGGAAARTVEVTCYPDAHHGELLFRSDALRSISAAIHRATEAVIS